MARFRLSLILTGALWLACAPALPAQGPDAPLVHKFQRGDVQHYRVELTIRSEVDGYRPARVGSQTYAGPFSDSTGVTLVWRSTRSVRSVDGEGTAEVDETLDDFSYSGVPTQKDPDGGEEIRAALFGALQGWSGSGKITLRYQETQRGHLASLAAEAAPGLDDAPPVLTLWLRRALRPTSPLPNHPAREGERWQEPRAVRLPPWSDVQGTETGEWLAGPSPEISVVKLIRLHTVQQISGSVPPSAGENRASAAENREATAPGQGRFHAESLNTLVHLGSALYGGYGSLHSATRSASREITRVVEGVPNLSAAPVFRARLSVEVRIRVIE